MKYISLILIISLSLFSCIDENEFKQSNPLPEAPEGKVNMTLDLAAAGFDKPTKNRATLSDTDIKNAWAIVFENPTTGNYSTDATVREVVEVTLAPDGRSGYAVMAASQRPTFILLIANTSLERSKIITPGMPYQIVINDALFYGDPATQGEGRLAIPQTKLLFSNENGELTTPIPMSGVSQILPKIEKGVKFSNAVHMARVVNKLYVNATAANAKNGFVLNGISLLGTHVTTPFDLAGALGIKPTQRAPGTDLYQIAGGAKDVILKNITDNTTKSATIDRPVYYYESYKPFDIIVAGTPQGSATVRYYKANVAVTTEGNASVVVNIQSVQNNGYATMDEAITAPAGSGIVVEALILDESHEIIANGQYYMGLSNSEFQLYADGEQKNVTVATISTNAFSSGTTAPTSRIELVSGTNMTLVAGQSISSNSTDIKVDFNDRQTANGTIRVTIGDLTRDIIVKKDWAITGNFKTGDEGFLIASDIISAEAADNNPRIGLGTTQTSSERNQSLQSSAGTAGYLFIKNTIDEDILEVRALTAAGRTILVRNVTNIPEFAGNNVYWDDANDRPKFDNYITAANEGTLNIQGVTGLGLGSLVFGPGSSIINQANLVKSPSGRTFRNFPTYDVVDIPESKLVDKKAPLLPNEDFGDICIFMTRRGFTPINKTGQKWKYPTIADAERLPKRQIKVGDEWNSFLQHPQQLDLVNGLSKVNNHFNFADLFIFPQNVQYSHRDNMNVMYHTYYILETFYLKVGTQMQWNSFACVNNSPLMKIRFIASNDQVAMGYSVRCVRDDSPGAVIPLYKIKYDLTSDGVILGPSNINSVFVNQNESVVLPKKLPNSPNGYFHIGWEIEGDFYNPGATVKNITKDIRAKAIWRKTYFAGSNIYYDVTNNRLAFKDHNLSLPDTEQGLFFKAFSMIGITGTGVYDSPYNANSIVFKPSECALDFPTFNDIQYINDGNLINDPSKAIGDICIYMTNKGWTPPGKWRSPKQEDFSHMVNAFYANQSVLQPTYWNKNGTELLKACCNVGGVYFPPSGMRLGYDGSGKLNSTGSYLVLYLPYDFINTPGQSLLLAGSDKNKPPTIMKYSSDLAVPVRCVRYE